MSGKIWYVHYATGSDGASPLGQSAERPLKTLAQAHTNASNNDWIVLKSGHDETLSAAVVITKKLTIIGEGTVDGKPSVKLRRSADVRILTQNAQGVIANIYFPSDTVAATIERVFLWDESVIRGCYLELNGNCGGASGDMRLPSDLSTSIEDCTFISTATTAVSRPKPALYMDNQTRWPDVSNVVFDGGVFGFETFAVDIASSGTTEGLRFTGIKLLRGADMRIATGITGFVQVTEATGGARVEWY